MLCLLLHRLLSLLLMALCLCLQRGETIPPGSSSGGSSGLEPGQRYLVLRLHRLGLASQVRLPAQAGAR
jgi:hypothetical protein